MQRIPALLFLFILISPGNYALSTQKPLIYPIPVTVKPGEGVFTPDKSTALVVSGKRDSPDDFPALLLAGELADKFGYPINTVGRPSFTGKGKFILIGDLGNPLVKSYCDRKGLSAGLKKLGNEGYILSVSGNEVVVAANNRSGALWGLASLRQIIYKNGNAVSIPQLLVSDKPLFPFRGIKLYLPGRENISFFKRFIKDFTSLYKFNKIILELNANMRLNSHPELNTGAVAFAKYLNYSRLGRPNGPHMEFQNSSHQDNADGQILEKAEVADLVAYMRKFGIEVIPELPSLTHSFYLLAGHRELAENTSYEYPDTWCPLKPENYKIYFDVLDEYIDVIHPAMIHVGHDEWRVEKNVCPLCRGKDYGELYATDLNKIHDHLAAKGIKTAIWGDHLLESVTGKDHQNRESSIGYKYQIPGALTAAQVLKRIPKDILIFNWFWDQESNDKQISDFGFKQVYGNMRPEIKNWIGRKNIKGLIGGAPSSWSASTELNMGKDMIYEMLADANLLWSVHDIPIAQTQFINESFMGGIHRDLSGITAPSQDGSAVHPVSLSGFLNSPLTDSLHNLKSLPLLSGSVKIEKVIFSLPAASAGGNQVIVAGNGKNRSTPTGAEGIEINKDISSIIFLHASAQEAPNQKAYNSIYNVVDDAGLVGWYEIVYEDGFTESIPVRYGVNILDWHWRRRIMNHEKGSLQYNMDEYAYRARAVECSSDSANPVTFFSFEWINPRFGKKVKTINIRSVNAAAGRENELLVMAISITENEQVEAAKGTENF